MKKLVEANMLTCETCKHFCQHYRKWGKGYYPIYCGHCKYPQIKKRTKEQTCRYWTPVED